jgi:hypothetical protein
VPVVTPDGRLLAVLDVDSGARCTASITCMHVHAPAAVADASSAPESLRGWLFPRCIADLPAAFTTVDAEQLQRLCGTLGARQWKAGL